MLTILHVFSLYMSRKYPGRLHGPCCKLSALAGRSCSFPRQYCIFSPLPRPLPWHLHPIFLCSSTVCPSFDQCNCCMKLTQILSLSWLISSPKCSGTCLYLPVKPNSTWLYLHVYASASHENPKVLTPSVNLGFLTVCSRGWPSNGNFFPASHCLVIQTPKPGG